MKAAWPTAFGMLGLGISDEYRSLFKSGPGWFLLGVSILVVYAGVQGWIIWLSSKRETRLSAMRQEIRAVRSERDCMLASSNIRALQVRPFVYAYLQHLGTTQLDFCGRPHEADRLTLFVHNAAEKRFVPFCRYSNSADFTKIVRTDYPENEGCLGLAWKKGVYRSRTYPYPESVESYNAHSESDGFPIRQVLGLRMKSRVYCGTVIWSAERNQAVGVLMCESTMDRIGDSRLTEIIKSETHGPLGVMLDWRR
jgi:hypothetical protein